MERTAKMPTLTGAFVSQPLPNNEMVVYSPNGTARPFLLFGVALRIFEVLQNGGDLTAFPADVVDAVLRLFATEKMVNDPTILPFDVPEAKPKERVIALWIHTTERCNLQCSYCYVTKGKHSITPAVYQRVVKALGVDIKTGGISSVEFKFAGGEPLLKFGQVVGFTNYARAKFKAFGAQVKPTLVTNATLITPEIVRVLKELGFVVLVSLDGVGSFNSARHYRNGKSSFEAVVRGLDALQKGGIQPLILCTISNQSVGGLEQLFRFVTEHDLHLSLSLSRDYDPVTGPALDSETVGKVLIPLLRDVAMKPESLLHQRLGFNGISFTGKKTKLCSASTRYFGITPTGGVSSCQMTVDTPITTTVPTREGLLSLAANHTAVVPSGSCYGCIWRYACCAGCEVLAKTAGTLGKPSVFCNLMQNMLPLVLAIDGRRLQSTRAKK